MTTNRMAAINRKNEVKRMVEAGETYTAIMEKLGITRKNVSSIVCRLKIKPNGHIESPLVRMIFYSKSQDGVLEVSNIVECNFTAKMNMPKVMRDYLTQAIASNQQVHVERCQ